MFKPKKSLGQNFLIDNNIIDKIIKLSDIKNNNIVEIGPGSGNLTNNLKNEFNFVRNLKIYNEDILKFQLEDKIKTDSIIIGNLPYNISSQILAKLIKFKIWLPKYKKLVLMFQKEVADKILAKHKTSSFGRLAILTNSRLKVTECFNVSENCFYPIPKVKSTVLVFEPIINKDFVVQDVSNLEKITHIFFSKKRKMVNKAFNILFKKPYLVAEKNKIDLSLRPNQISEKQFYKITESYEKKL